MRPRAALHGMALCAVALLAACNGDDDSDGGPGPDTTDSGPVATWDDCETSALRYDTFAQPLLATWCTPCHASNLEPDERSGAPVGLDFDSYDNVVAVANLIASSIEDERMPPVGGLSQDERDAFVAWVECGTPRGEATEPVPQMCDAPVTVTAGELDCTDAAQAQGVTVSGDLAPTADQSCVCTVAGDLSPSGAVVMAHLERVDGAVLLTSGTTELPSLEEAGSLSVAGAGVQVALLDALEVVHGDIYVTDTTMTRFDLPRLDRIEGDLFVSNNQQVTQGLRFANVTEVHGSARFVDNDAMAAQVLFGHLERFDGDIEVLSNDGIESLVGLADLVELGGGIRVEDNATLRLVNIGIRLESVGKGLSILGNPELTLVETFPLLVSIGRTGSGSDPRQTSLYLAGNSDLEAVAAFPALEEMRGLYIGGALRLASVGPFPSLELIPGDVVVENTRQLQTAPSLGSVRDIGGDLRIEGNRALDDLLPLGTVDTIGGDLSISGNDVLPTADAQFFADSVDVGGTTTVAGNQ